MTTQRTSHLAALVCAVCLSTAARAQGLPSEAQVIVDEYRKAADAAQAKADAELALVRQKLLPRLKALQDKYCRAAKLDEALAVRETIWSLMGIQPDPGTLSAGPELIGRSMLFAVTGSTEGSVWGAEVYTTDSHLGTAAVHAGLLKPGEKGVVRVKILAGQKSYRSSTANGVTTQDYGPWATSFTLDRPKDLGGY